jgi:hypothetical protein
MSSQAPCRGCRDKFSGKFTNGNATRTTGNHPLDATGQSDSPTAAARLGSVIFPLPQGERESIATAAE